MLIVVFLADELYGELKEVIEGLSGDVLDGLLGLAVVIDGGILDGDALERGDELVALVFLFSRELFIGVRLDVKEDLALGVHIKDGVLEGAVADVEAADFTAAGGDITAELTSCDKRAHHGFAASVAAFVLCFREDF